MAATVGGQTNHQCSVDYDGYYLYAVSPAFLFARYNMQDRSGSTAASGVSASVAGGFQNGAVYQSIEQSDLTQYQANVGYSAAFVPSIVNASGNAWENAANSNPPSGGRRVHAGHRGAVHILAHVHQRVLHCSAGRYAV